MTGNDIKGIPGEKNCRVRIYDIQVKGVFFAVVSSYVADMNNEKIPLTEILYKRACNLYKPIKDIPRELITFVPWYPA